MRAVVCFTVLAFACTAGGPSSEMEPDPRLSSERVEVPQRVRLLSRREYSATLRDLLTPPGGSCASDTDCDIDRASCVEGVCQTDPCSTRTFTFPVSEAPTGGGASVAVAGTFNGWEPTWLLTHEPALDLFVGKYTLADGEHAYKMVVDGDWFADPGNPATVDDGFGGVNSVITIACGATTAPDDPSAGLPAEGRPDGFAFDTHAASGLVSTVHVEEYLEAGMAAAADADWPAILACDPVEDGCVEDFLTTFGRRALRRPLDAAETASYRAIFESEVDPWDGAELAAQAMLSSPAFLYRFEIGVEAGEGVAKLDGFETASALSYFLWGTGPDEALLDAAAMGELDTVDGIEGHARRMLDNPRARQTVRAFTRQWLGIEAVPAMDRAPFPAFDSDLGSAMVHESERFVEHVTFDGSGQYADLLTAEFTFVDAALADHYGVPKPDVAWGEVAVPHRSGVLGHAAVLTANAYSDQTSPIRRGLFVRERLLCQELPPPPPDAGGVPDVDPNATTRERYAQHSSDPSCSGCHQYIDEVGFGFERFDAVGAWRETENGQPIDASGDLNDVNGLGSQTSGVFSTLSELGAIVATSDAGPSCFTRQMHRFAMGQTSREGDPGLEALFSDFQASNHDIRELMVAISTSPGMVFRTVTP